MANEGLRRMIEKAAGHKIPENSCEHNPAPTADQMHGCPFKIEIHDDHEYKCGCCKECEYECAMDI